MEKDLIIACRFSDFLQAYCGSSDSEEQFEIAKDSLLDDNNIYITDEELMRIYHEFVEIRVVHYNCTDSGTVYDDLLLQVQLTPKEQWKYSCSCIDPEQVLKDIISVNFKK